MCAMAETKARDAEVDEREGEEAGQQAAVLPNAGTPVTPLAVPCTLQQLRSWLNGVDGLIQANTKTVTCTASSISVA
jgi:hypothetical protein